MCEYCEDEKTIIDHDILNGMLIGWEGYSIDASNADYLRYVLFIDRGFLRFADSEDCQCMDHGQSVKISFCPFCGKKLSDVL